MRMRTLLAAVASAACLSAVVAIGSTTASAAPSWAPAETATVHPGVQTYTAGGQCTANFVFTDATDVYIGQAAHCSGTGGQTETNGCLAGSLPLGTQVEVDGATRPGTMVYNSWLTMQQVGETNQNACAYNDFALIKLDPADHGRVNPSIPFWGGPTGVGDATAALERGVQLRQLQPAPRPHRPVAQDRHQPRHQRRRVEPPRVHGLARHPR